MLNAANEPEAFLNKVSICIILRRQLAPSNVKTSRERHESAPSLTFKKTSKPQVVPYREPENPKGDLIGLLAR